MRSASRERRRADRHDHELLEVDRVVGVRAAVEHVHHRHRQDVRRRRRRGSATAAGRCSAAAALRRGQRHAEDRVGAEARLVRRAVELDQRAVEARLVGRVAAASRPSAISPLTLRDRLRARPCRRTRRRRRAARSPRTRRSRRPTGTAARPVRAGAQRTARPRPSGLPRLSRIWRAWTVLDLAHRRAVSPRRAASRQAARSTAAARRA